MKSLPQSMMATRFYGSMDLRVEAFPMPTATAGRVVLRIKAVGVCPSGLKMLKDASRVPEAFRRVPGFPGHETAAEVVEVGEGVTEFKPADRVVPSAGPTCGHCHACRRGRFRFCEQQDFDKADFMSFAEYMACDAEDLLPIPDNLQDEQAAFCEPLACCVASMEKCALQPGDNVVILGAGTMGLLHLQLARAHGGKVIVLEQDEGRRAFAAKMGAHAALLADQAALSKVKALTGGRGAAAVIITAGSAQAIEQGFHHVAPGGTLMLFAGTWPATSIELDPNLIHYRQIQVTGSVGGLMVDFERALTLLAHGLVDVGPLISARYPLNKVLEAHRASESLSAYKVLVIP